MRSLTLAVLLVALGGACGDREPVGETDTDTDTDTDSDAIPDMWEDLGPDPGCEDYDGTPHPAATRYFLGDFRLDGDEVTGWEHWALYANEAWADVGGADCTVTWDITGTVGAPVSCTTCDMSLDIDADVSLADTTCAAAVYAGEESFSVRYDVRLSSDGTTQFYFASSGNELGGWYGTESRVTYVSDSACSWF